MNLATLLGTPRLLNIRIARTPYINNRLPLLWRWQSEW